ncbi:hypothetical protein [Nocardia yamanashiensis]|uniref:hypothetical protein n=1 Tax=Nocardia yamanashiensis TaxID=209247 RepID=UPI000830C2DA|nr:hypothetical protein [Nocardia yamanashiensis]
MREPIEPDDHPHPEVIPAGNSSQLAPTPERDVYDAIVEHLEAEAAAVFDPENNLVAALLNLDATQAAAVLAYVQDDDLQGHLPRTAIGLIRQLAVGGADPTPQAVAARARGHLAVTPRPSPQSVLMYLANVYTTRLPLTAWADAAQVVEDSYRRSFAEHGARMEQMSDAYAPISDLEQMTGDAVRLWREMRQRLAHLREHPHT